MQIVSTYALLKNDALCICTSKFYVFGIHILNCNNSNCKHCSQLLSKGKPLVSDHLFYGYIPNFKFTKKNYLCMDFEKKNFFFFLHYRGPIAAAGYCHTNQSGPILSILIQERDNAVLQTQRFQGQWLHQRLLLRVSKWQQREDQLQVTTGA